MTNQDQQSAEQAAQISARGAARRRFTRAGLGITGALATITSRAAMASDICTTPSGSLSGGLKSHHGPAPACVGRSPGYWKNHSSWPCSKTITFGSIFSCSSSSPYYKTTLQEILNPQKWDKHELGSHLVATYLNILSGKISFLTVPTIQGMWNDLYRRGYYNPTAGVKWFAYDVVDYLTGTMG